ncbi:MAG: DUF1653 domain-containing protein [Patescibacteria group bacterium]
MQIEPGIYQHFKGNEYKVVGIAKHSETLEDFVVYEALYDNKNSKLWIRPAAMFQEEIEKDGKKISRFKKIRNL